MIELVYSNRTERLLEKLAANLRMRRGKNHPLEPVELVVPNRNMETWVRLGLAQSNGIAANLRFSWLNCFIGNIVTSAFPGDMKLVDLDTVEAAVLAVLLNDTLLDEPELQPVRRYLKNTVHSTGGDQAGFIKQTAPATGLPLSGQTGYDTRLATDGADLRRVQLASRMAFLFQEYTFSRPEMIAAWRGKNGGATAGFGPAGLPFADPAAIDPSLASTVAWQRALWRAVFCSGGILEQNPPGEGGRWTTMDLLALDDGLFEKIGSIGLPTVHIFGVSYVARLFQLLFARLGEIGTLRIYTLNPCAEFWEDVETHREFFYRLDREMNRRSQRIWNGAGETGDEDPFGLFDADTPALRYWGRPGREHVRLLGELTDCDFTGAFEDPVGENDGLLQRLQHDILFREPERSLGQNRDIIEDSNQCAESAPAMPCLPDETIKLLAAPSVRREVEWVADEIWRLMREDKPQPGQPPLRFSDVAIIVNSAGRDVYLPQIEAVFAACQNLPSSISDLPGASSSRLIEAMGLLLKLPFGRFSRAEMLTMMGHPAVIGNFDNLTPDELAARTEALGIFFGADHSDHAGTYIDEDVYNWDQGIRRLALGAFMTGGKSGEERVFETGSGRWLVEEISGTAVPAAARFGLLARSLIADARFVRDRQMTLTEWSRFYTAQIEAYLNVEEGSDERDRLRLLRALVKLESMDLGHLVSGRIAAEIASRTIDKLEGGQGQYLAEGVVVSSFLPMRAIPFKVVFLLGLGEGLFPASGQRDALDLRAARRRAGDVDPSERDRYMFLETLLCTREKLYLSYLRRDEQTGDPLQPSAVVQELLHILKSGYLGEDGLKHLRIEPPLRRYDENFTEKETFFDEALAEARILDIAGDWRVRANRAGSAGSFQPGDELGEIAHIADPETWTALSRMLILPGKLPAASAVTATARFAGPDGESAIEAPISLTLSVLRRFLECPMQGWASAMLGLTEIEEDQADQEEEDFEINRLTETMILNDVFYNAASTGSDPEKLYREKSTRLRLAGQVPVGSLGRVIEKRHLGIIEGWFSLLANLQAEGKAPGTNSGSADLIHLHRVRLGQSNQQGFNETVVDPLLLEATAGSRDKPQRVVPVRISGLTEGFLNDRQISLVFQPKKPPGGKDRKTLSGSFRYLLRGAVSQAALAAMGAAGSGERQIVICYADSAQSTGMLKVRLHQMEADRARAWLTAIAGDLLGGAHAYLLPCEAAFLEYKDRGEGLPVNGAALRALVKEMAGNEWSRFSSLWGPVPSPRLYKPPSIEQAVEIVSRRFEPFFGDIIDMEVLR